MKKIQVLCIAAGSIPEVEFSEQVKEKAVREEFSLAAFLLNL
jgi:hypothetical protein